MPGLPLLRSVYLSVCLHVRPSGNAFWDRAQSGAREDAGAGLHPGQRATGGSVCLEILGFEGAVGGWFEVPGLCPSHCPP
jgi:hypothetical protein